jgi:hypothetical protein
VAKTATDNIAMFEGLMNGLRGILQRLEMPGGIDGAQGDQSSVAKNIVPSSTSTFNKLPPVKAILDSNEKTRAYNIGLEWARAFFTVEKEVKSGVDTSKPSTIISKAQRTAVPPTDEKSKEPTVMKGLGLLGMVAATLAAAVAIWEMFGGEGGFVMKAITKLPSFLKLLKGTAGKIGARILKRIKFIPFIGALAGFVFAYMRFQDGDWVRGTLELVSALLGLTGVGLPLALIIDGAMLLYDISEEKGSDTGMVSAVVKGGKYATKAIFSVLKKLTSTIGAKLLKALKWVPFIGGVAGLALSFMRFREGEWLAGTVEFVSAILDFIPGVGNIASYILDGALLLYDIFKAPKEEKDKPKSTLSFSFSNGMAYLKTIIGPIVTKALPYIPVIGNFMSIYKGIQAIMSGDYSTGIRELIKGMFIFLPPALTEQIIGGVEWLYSLFNSEENNETPSAPKPVSFLQKVKEFIKSKLKALPGILRKPLEWLGILDDKSGEPSGLSTVVSSAVETVQDGASAVMETAKNIGSKVVDSVTSGISSLLEKAQSFISGAIEVAKNSISSAFKAIQSFVVNALDTARNIILTSAAFQSIKNIGSEITEMVKNKFTFVKEDNKTQDENYRAAATADLFDGVKNTTAYRKAHIELLKKQNQALLSMLNIAEMQLQATKNIKPTIINNSGSQGNVDLSSNAFDTGTSTSRGMYDRSPYAIS